MKLVKHTLKIFDAQLQEYFSNLDRDLLLPRLDKGPGNFDNLSS